MVEFAGEVHQIVSKTAAKKTKSSKKVTMPVYTERDHFEVERG
jgi:hypothetical protein